MAAGRYLLTFIRNGDSPSGNVPTELDPCVVEAFIGPSGQSKGWVSISSDGGDITIGGTGDELIFTSGTIEYTAPDDQGAPYEVGGFRINGNGGEGVYPETLFTDIVVEANSTLRFTELKLTLT